MKEPYDDLLNDYLIVLPPIKKRRPLPEHAKQFIDEAVNTGVKRGEDRLNSAMILRQSKHHN